MKNNIMIDIETLGRSHNAVIVQIAAVQFDPLTGEMGSEFLCFIDAENAQKHHNRKIDASTAIWWLKQSDEARKAVFENAERLTLFDAMLELRGFIDIIIAENLDDVIIWGNSPSFDLEILKSSFNTCGINNKWEYYNERDFRTISKIFPDIAQTHKYKGVHHFALDDCKSQIAILHKCMSRIFVKNTEGVQNEK
jgi:exodeoxyribonuclease VIII